MEEKQLKKIEKILEFLSEEYIKPDDLKVVFEILVENIDKMKSEIEQNMAQNKGEMTEDMMGMHQEMMNSYTMLESMMSKMEGKMTEAHKQIMQQCMNKIKEVEATIPTPTDLTEIEEKIRQVENKIPEIPDIPDLKPLEEEVEVIKEDIEVIKKDIEVLKKRPIGGGGGTSAIAVAKAFKYIFKAETPSGTINGSNTDFTVQNGVWAILGIELNGEVYPSTGYSFKNGTITFTVAPPSVYSGKDFICKYIAI